jgi:hypothetical protein
MTVPTAIDNAAIPGLNCILHLTNPVRFVRAAINLILRATTATRTKKWLAPLLSSCLKSSVPWYSIPQFPEIRIDSFCRSCMDLN